MTGYESKKAAAQAKTIDEVNWLDHEPNGLVHTARVDYEKLAALGWQAIECPFCGSSGAQAFPKPVVQPAQRPWVELTDDEVNTLWSEWKDAVCLDHKTWAKAVEAKLKEKNT
jgi:hypothetical protein